MAGTVERPVVVDGSPSALDAVRWAAEAAVRRGLGLKLVHGYQTPPGLPGVGAECGAGRVRAG